MQEGVTLLELLVTLSIAVMLLTVGVSGMTTLVKRNARAVEVNAMVGHLNFARAQAILRAATVVVCPIDPANATAGCDLNAGSAAWAGGYGVVDVDRDVVLRLVGASAAISLTSGQAGGGSNGFAFADDGTLSGSSGFKTNGSIHFCDRDPDGIDGIRVTVSRMGRVRLSEDGVNCPTG